MTHFTASQHLCINARSYCMYVHGKTKKELKRNLNLACEEQTNKETETYKHKIGQNKSI